MPTTHHSKTLSSLTALVCVVSVLFVASDMIAMNHYAVMIVYFCNQYNFEGVGGGPFHLSVFKCTVSVSLSFFVLENKVDFHN